MLRSVNLNGAPSFSIEGCELQDLGRINFVFGANGTGKTTISRCIADPERFPTTSVGWADPEDEPEVRVFNRDYIQKTILEAENLPGVFVLDSESPEEREEYTELTKSDGTISKLTAKVGNLEIKLERLDSQLEEAERQLVDTAWAARDKVPDVLHVMFDGFKGSKEVFSRHLREIAKVDPPDLEDLVRESRSAFSNEGTPLAKVAAVPDYDELTRLPGYSSLADAVVGSSDVTLSYLIRTLGNHDWVAAGRTFAHQADGTCPFCQQALPEDFLGQLANYFDSEYEARIDAIRELQSAVASSHEKILSTLDAINQLDPAMVSDRFEKVSKELKHAVVRNEELLAHKLAAPGEPIQLVDVAPAITELNELIIETNRRVSEHNDRLVNRAAAKRVLVARCWQYFAWGVLGSEMSHYLGVLSGIEEPRATVAQEVEALYEQLRSAQARAETLERLLVSSAPAIAQVNNLLSRVGFRRFQIVASEGEKDAYRLQRPDGSPVGDSLSDGERTFVTFLYFLVQVESRHRASDRSRLVAVIDDPISSLDSEVLFVVSSLVRRLFILIHQEQGRLCQAIVLTHNTQFYLELTYPRAYDRDAGLMRGRRYFELRAATDGATIVVPSDEGSIRSSYRRLWDVVRTTTSSDEPAGAGLENVLRRILENYFTVIGSYANLDALIEAASGEEGIAYRALLAWLHHGSHTFIDDLDYSVTPISTRVFLTVFKEIFAQTNQLGHYNMMMGNDVPE